MEEMRQAQVVCLKTEDGEAILGGEVAAWTKAPDGQGWQRTMRKPVWLERQ